MTTLHGHMPIGHSETLGRQDHKSVSWGRLEGTLYGYMAVLDVIPHRLESSTFCTRLTNLTTSQSICHVWKPHTTSFQTVVLL